MVTGWGWSGLIDDQVGDDAAVEPDAVEVSLLG